MPVTYRYGYSYNIKRGAARNVKGITGKSAEKMPLSENYQNTGYKHLSKHKTGTVL